MTPYYLFLITPLIFIFSKNEKLQRPFLLFFLLSLSLFLGLRFEMGTDWYEYSKDFYQQLQQFDKLRYEQFFKINSFINLSFVNLVGNMPLYKLSILTSNYITQNIIFFNILNSTIVVFGTYFFCKTLKLKNSSIWLIFVFLLPFLYFISTDIIRQFSGLIFVSIAFGYLLQSNKKKFFYFTLIGAFFHISSIIFFSILFFIDKKIRHLIVIFLIITNALTFFYFENIYLIKLFNFYLSEQRLMTYSINFNLILMIFPFFLFFYLFKKIKFTELEQKVLSFFIFYGLICILISLFDDTASYRLSVYLLIFYSIVIIKYLSFLDNKSLYWFKNSMITFSLLLLTIWLNFSNHAHVYVPYKNVLLINENFSDTRTQICARKVQECKFVQ